MPVSTHKTYATKKAPDSHKESDFLKAPDRLLTEKEAAELFGVRPGTLRSWRTTGRVGQPRWVKLNRAVRYRASDCAAWISGLSSGDEL